MKHYTTTDVDMAGTLPRIYTSDHNSNLAYCPLPWQKRGLQETSTGFGARLNTGYKIHFNGRLYRVYCTCYSNAGSCWFIAKGRKIFVG